MSELQVTIGRLAHMAGGRQHRYVFARAVVVDCGRCLSNPAHLMGAGIVRWPMDAASQRVDAEAEAREPGFHRFNMPSFAIVRGAGQRNLGITHVKRFGRAGFDQGDGLQRLDRRARIDHGSRIAPAAHHPGCGIDDDSVAAMMAFGHGAASDFDQHGRRVDRLGLRAFGGHIVHADPARSPLASPCPWGGGRATLPPCAAISPSVSKVSPRP